MGFEDNLDKASIDWVYLLEIEVGHRIDGDSWAHGGGGGDYFYIADSNNYRIKKHKISDLSYVAKIGSFGSGDDQFNEPKGVCSDGTYIYVVDSGGNHRIVKRLCSDLSYVSKIGSNGSGNDQFDNPLDICTDGTHIYVADSYNHRIVKRLCSDLSYVSKIGSQGSGNDQFDRPCGICTDGTYLYISDTDNHRIKKHLCSDLSYVSKFGSQGSPPGDDEFNLPREIATDNTYLYIVDYYTRVKKHLCSDLSYVADEEGTAPNQFDTIYGIACDGVHIYVSDIGTNFIQKRKCSDLSYVSKAGGTGSGDDEYDNPEGAGYDYLGTGSAYFISHSEGKPSKVEENGVEYTEKNTLADCKSTASSWYWDSSNNYLYVHTSGSDDPGGGSYIILSYFWEYFCNKQPEDDLIIFNDVYYLPYLNDDDIPAIDLETTGYHEGGTKQSFGSISLNNADGHFDSRLTDYIYEIKKVLWKIGKLGDSYSDYQVLWRGWTGSIEWSDEEIVINIEDMRRFY